MSDAGTERTGPEPRGAVRLTFAYEGDEVRLVSSRRLDKLVPADPGAEEAAGRRGIFAEVRGADGGVLHRRLLHPPVRRDAEVFSDDPGRSLGRVPLERPSGVFSLVVPDLEDADHVALVERGAPERPGLAAAPADLIRVPLRGPDGPGAGGAS